MLVAQSCLTLWLHGLGPARLLCPWDFPGKNTGVGCHSLLQGIFLNQGSNPGLNCGQTLPSEPLQFSSVRSLSCVWLFATPWTAARQASLPISNSWNSPKSMFTESVMPSSHLILCRPLLLLPSIFPSIRVFSNESGLRIMWPKYRDFSFNISLSNELLLLLIPLYHIYM